MWCGPPHPPPLSNSSPPAFPWRLSPSSFREKLQGLCECGKKFKWGPEWLDWGPSILNLENTVPVFSLVWDPTSGRNSPEQPRCPEPSHTATMLKDSWYIINWLISFKPQLCKTNGRPIIGGQDVPPPKAIGMNLSYRQTEKNNFCPLFPFDILFWHFNYMFPHLTFASACLQY